MAPPDGADATRDRLRILFDLVYPGYLRYFDSVIKELAARGHHVEVWFEKPLKQPEGLEALRDVPDVHVGGAMPKRERPHRARTRVPRTLADFVRYLHPRFADAQYLRDRAGAQLPFVLRPLRRLRTLPPRLVDALLLRLVELEHVTPPSETISSFVRERGPDVVFVAPYVFFRGTQADVGAAAQAQGIPTVAAIASWDNLTTKGLIRGNPECVVVWNEAQAREAVELHGLPRERISVTGAQPFDKWFDRSPALDAASFAERVGLRPGLPYLLFVGSTASISAPDAERQFVREWLTALRGSVHPSLQHLGVLIRPHPYNSRHWSSFDADGFDDVVVWPSAVASPNPVDEDDRSDYFHSIHHAAAVVGINTSAMIEAAVIGRPVFTITPDDFRDTQRGTLHFRHLLPANGGFVHAARTIEEHLDQLAAAVEAPEATADMTRAFVASFIRPLGLERDATPVVADVIERAAATCALPRPSARQSAPALARMLERIDALDRLIDPRRLAKRIRRHGTRDRQRGRRAVAALQRAEANGVPTRLRPFLKGLRKVVDTSTGSWEQLAHGTAARLAEPSSRRRAETYGRGATIDDEETDVREVA